MAAHLVLLLAEVTGFYTFSSVLLIRKNVPLKYRSVSCTTASQSVLGVDCSPELT
jgi:hypothetical protein